MKAEIRSDGFLYIGPESEIEAYALKRWCDETIFGTNWPKIVIDTEPPKVVERKPVKILGVDALLVGQEYWIDGKGFIELVDIADARRDGCPASNVSNGVALHYWNRPIIYKSELD